MNTIVAYQLNGESFVYDASGIKAFRLYYAIFKEEELNPNRIVAKWIIRPKTKESI